MRSYRTRLPVPKSVEGRPDAWTVFVYELLFSHHCDLVYEGQLGSQYLHFGLVKRWFSWSYVKFGGLQKPEIAMTKKRRCGEETTSA